METICDGAALQLRTRLAQWARRATGAHNTMREAAGLYLGRLVTAQSVDAELAGSILHAY